MAKSTVPEDDDRTYVYLGNRNAISVKTADDGTRERVPGSVKKTATHVVVEKGLSLMQAAYELTNPNGVWRSHSDADAPAWVASTDPALASLLAAHWGCELRDYNPGEASAEPAVDESVEG